MEVIKEARPRINIVENDVQEAVASIISEIRTDGDKGLRRLEALFGGNERESFAVSRSEIEAAYAEVPEELLADIRAAAANVRAFAEAQRATIGDLPDFCPSPGVHLGHKVIPVSSALCYVPGGNYPLYSTALMLVIPAKVAGVDRVCACSPVNKETGRIDSKTLVAMDTAGVDEIYAMGGAQAIAAFSYGTETIRPVDVIVGPGNKYVAEAKRQCYGQVGIDFVAGPSEVMVIADGSGDPVVVAADLLAQAEHDVNAKALLVSLDRGFALNVIKAVEAELAELPTAGIAQVSWDVNGEVLLAKDPEEAIELANRIAPEHLELNVADPEIYFETGAGGTTNSAAGGDAVCPGGKLRNFGSLFIGQNTAEVFGDYASGTNHTLPTVGAARYTGGLSVGNFLKTCTYQSMTDEASAELSGLTARLAYGEGLYGHARAAEERGHKK